MFPLIFTVTDISPMANIRHLLIVKTFPYLHIIVIKLQISNIHIKININININEHLGILSKASVTTNHGGCFNVTSLVHITNIIGVNGLIMNLVNKADSSQLHTNP